MSHLSISLSLLLLVGKSRCSMSERSATMIPTENSRSGNFSIKMGSYKNSKLQLQMAMLDAILRGHLLHFLARSISSAISPIRRCVVMIRMTMNSLSTLSEVSVFLNNLSYDHSRYHIRILQSYPPRTHRVFRTLSLGGMSR